MKKNIFIIFIFVFTLFISQPSFSFDLNGWWIIEKKAPNSPVLLKITNERFLGLKYTILSSSKDEIRISIDNGKPTIIKINSKDTITIMTVNNDIMKYKCITHDTNLSKEEAKKIVGEN